MIILSTTFIIIIIVMNTTTKLFLVSGFFHCGIIVQSLLLLVPYGAVATGHSRNFNEPQTIWEYKKIQQVPSGPKI